ncbi:MAG: carbamoyltransferase HypF [Peptococcaceae bacterium]|nr:carbamoyltransferase HypF [Peptococcaceae bacterium]
MDCKLIILSGVVQGIGMRPFLYRLGRDMGVCGWVSNTGNGVTIHAEGDSLDGFVRRIMEEKPPLASIDGLTVQPAVWQGYQDFVIMSSCESMIPDVLISPDLAVCDDCLRNIYDSRDRRFGYPFTNCTNCGPRYTIVRERPYDRIRTTMAPFAMCRDCAREYHDPEDRRFHAQPVACPRCGPELVFCGPEAESRVTGNDALAKARRMLLEGGIVALKGLGGFHLSCDARNREAVRALRRRKERGAKPFAVMASDLDVVRNAVFLSELEEAWLTSAAAPIVLLRLRQSGTQQDGSLPTEEIAPGLDTLGIMLPYTPLHSLLMHEGFPFLVLTSANLSGQPLIYRNEEALEKLDGLADGFLLHDRDIFHPCDDSVVCRIGDDMTFYRRARGYVPLPLRVGSRRGETAPRKSADLGPSLLAVGADMKNAFCFLEGERAFLSPYLGEMSDKLSFDRFCREISSWKSMLHFQPDLIVHDAHPDYATTRWAKSQSRKDGVRLHETMHHHAHLVSVMGEHGLIEPTLGLVADGTGYGSDGRIWGCEILWGDRSSFVRKAHLQYLPLPGGDMGIRFPLRTAYAYFVHLFKDPIYWSGAGSSSKMDSSCLWQGLCDGEKNMLRAQVASGIQIDWTSSAGRLFDVMAALLGVSHEVTYEAQAAMELEALAWQWEYERRERAENAGRGWKDPQNGWDYFGVYSDLWREYEWNETLYPLTWYPHDEEGTDILSLADFFSALWYDILVAQDLEDTKLQKALAWKCHASLALGLGHYLDQTGADKKLVLAGGVFQNRLFTEMLEVFLLGKGWTVYRARQLPPGDGGIAFGQCLIASGQ